MKIYNELKNEILTNIDLTKGRLVEDYLEEIVPEVQEIKEVGHYETIKEYANGGKDVKWVVDTPAVPYQAQKINKIPIKVYIPYTQSELDEIEIKKKIARLEELTKDFAQDEDGLVIDDLETRKAEFRTLLNEVRVLQGKLPRQIIN